MSEANEVNALVMRKCICGHDAKNHDKGRKHCLVEGCACSIVNYECKCGHGSLDHDYWGGGSCQICECQRFENA